MIEYEELRIRMWPVAGDRVLMLMNGPHQTAGVVAISRLGSCRAMFDAILEAEHRGHADARPDAGMRLLGEELFAGLFPGPLASCLYDSLESAAALNRGMRLRFELPGVLGSNPVEALCLPADRGGRLATGPRMSIVRAVAGPGLPRGRLPGPRDEFEKLRVIVIVADPRRALPGQAVLPALDLAAEVAALTAELDNGVAGLAVDHEMLGLGAGPPVTRTEVQAAVERTSGRPCVVVLLGHGAPAGAVYLEEPDGTPDPVTGHVLVGDLAGANVRLVVLNLCGGGRFEASRPGSAVAEELVVGGIPAVVAMQADVSDAAAALFTPTLFRALRGNATLDEAVTRARIEMVDGGGGVTAEWATPVVVAHRQNRHGWLFKVTGLLAPGGEPPHDPLATGAADLAAVDDGRGGIDPGRLVGAAQHARNDGDWSIVERLAAAGRGLRPELDALGREAAFEAAADRIRRICDLLAAEDDPALAADLLSTICGRLPSTVVACLEAEIAAARRVYSTMAMARTAAAAQKWHDTVEYCQEVLADYPDGYQDATTLRDTAAAELDRARRYAAATALEAADDLTGAAAVFEQLATESSSGFRDAAGRWHYCVGLRALEQGDLRSAVEAFRAAGGHADAVARMETAAAQISMQPGYWAQAVEHLRRAAVAGADVGADLDYARAWEMIDSGDWQGALSLLRGMADDRPNVGELTRLAAGMLAASQRNWRAALRELGDLLDDYLHGAVGGARRLARAGIAVDDRRWGAALAELDGPPGPFADEVRRLAALAGAGVAEDRGDWAGAAAALRTLAGLDGELDDPELADMVAYADGRAAEDQKGWSGAETAYARVSPAHRDAGSRRVYARGRAAEDAGNLPTAIGCYLEVLAVEDAADRLVRCRLKEAVQRDDWDAALGQAELLFDPVERVASTAYARGRLAEEVADWDAAARWFAECRDHADAALREAYAQARADEAGGRWHRALGHYARVAGEHRDVATRRDRLTACLAALPWADGLPDAGLAELPGVAEPSPYAVLHPLGIDPGSSAREVNAAGFGVLRQRRGRGDQDALQRLRNRSARLAVDAELAVVRDPQALRAAMAALRPGPAPEMVAALRAAAPDDAGLVAMLGSGIDEALAEWDAAVRRDPADTTAARNLALVRERQAAQLLEAGNQEGAAAEWLRCVGLWVMVLLDDDHWRVWGTARARCYGLTVADEELRILRDGIADRLAQGADGAAPVDPGPGLTVHTERLAASLLGEVGGVPARRGPDSGRVVCGPVRLADAGLVDRFAALVASLQPTLGDDPTGPSTTAPGGSDPSRLRCAFSGLGPSLMLLERGQPARALAALPELGGIPLGTAATAPCTVAERRAGPDHRTGCAECRHFHDYHPAYLLLPNRTTQLVQDAAGIAVRAHVAVTRTAVLRDVPEIGAAVAALSEALAVSRAAGVAARARDVVARAAYDLAEDLAARRGPGRADRIERAVELLDRLVDGPLAGNARARAAMADALNHRGLLRAGLDEQERRRPDLAAAEADLRAAVRLNPAPSTVRANLAQVMLLRTEQKNERTPWTTVAAAADLVADGLGRAPRHRPLRSALETVCDVAERLALNTLSLDEVMELLGQPATGDVLTEERAGRHARAIQLACSAVKDDPDDERARWVLRDLLRSRAGHERSD